MSLFIGIALGGARLANASMLYLVAVLASAIGFGRGPAILAAVAAFLTFDWFFVEPLHQITIADPEEVLSLGLFLLVAVVTGQLAAEQRRRAGQAREREREAVVLADVARLAAEPDLDRALEGVAGRVQSELGLEAVGVLMRDRAPVVVPRSAEAERLFGTASAAATHALSAGTTPSAVAAGRTGRWVRVVAGTSADDRARRRLHSVPIGTAEARTGTLLALRRTGAEPLGTSAARLLAAAAAQIALSVDRARLRDEATEAEVLRRSDDLKSALLGAVSHELRTPLASIMASAGSLRQRDVDWTEAEREEFHDAIEQEVERLDRLVGELLDLSRIESGRLVLSRQYHPLDALVDDVLGRLRRITQAHRLAVEVPDDLPPISIDYQRMDQVLSNLVENAVKYAPTGTTITVRARRDAAGLRLEVADQGPGIRLEDRERAFVPFHRIRADGRAQGAGLGLAIARRLVEAHGGRIWIESAPGSGARVVISLPLAAEPVPR